MSVTSIAPVGSTSRSAWPVSAVTSVIERVSLRNGVRQASVVQRVPAAAAQALQAGALAASAQAASPASPLVVDMGFVGYNQQGTVAVADINPDRLAMSSVTVRVRLLKGFRYSVGSDFSYVRFGQSATASLLVMAPSVAKVQSLNLKGGSFTAQETGDYSFIWTLNNGARFDGGFSATLQGLEPALPPSTGNASLDAVLQRQNAWWHEHGALPSVGTPPVLPKVVAVAAPASN